jgi:hypothetical protein
MHSFIYIEPELLRRGGQQEEEDIEYKLSQLIYI